MARSIIPKILILVISVEKQVASEGSNKHYIVQMSHVKSIFLHMF